MDIATGTMIKRKPKVILKSNTELLRCSLLFLSSSVPLVLNQLYKVAISIKNVSFMNRFSWI